MSHETQLLRMLEPAVRPGGAPAPNVRPAKPVEQRSFQELLENAERTTLAEPRELKLSGHAQQRLSQRGIELSADQMRALAEAAALAETRGARDTLMLMNQLGMIVNVPNRTVLTVLSEDRMRSGVVTQIDSTVLVTDPAANQRPGRQRLNL